jgi:anti-sigma B factor antagonist
MNGDEREIREGLLSVRVLPSPGGCLVALDGEVDLSNARVLESALREALDGGAGRVVVDMRALSFIDSTGIACLVRLLHEDVADRLRFVHSDSPAVLRVLRLTGLEEKLTPADPG